MYYVEGFLLMMRGALIYTFLQGLQINLQSIPSVQGCAILKPTSIRSQFSPQSFKVRLQGIFHKVMKQTWPEAICSRGKAFGFNKNMDTKEGWYSSAPTQGRT